LNISYICEVVANDKFFEKLECHGRLTQRVQRQRFLHLLK